MNRFLPLTLARRELRAGAGGFRILIACLALGVGTIAAVQSLSRDILSGIGDEGRAVMGGDISVRVLYREATPDETAILGAYGTVSADAELRGMARTPDGAKSSLVEVRAVDGKYPLAGHVEFEPPAQGATLPDIIGVHDGVWGVAVEPAVLQRLGVRFGDRVRLGDLDYEIRGVIAKEPDRIAAGGFTLGPRFLVALDSLQATGLIQPGSLIYHDYRILLPQGRPATAATEAISRRFASAGWRVTDAEQSAPQIKSFVTRLATFLTLVGLTALLVGGVGVGNAVKSYLDGRIGVIATMKCLGAPGRLIVWTYLIQVMALASVGIAIGLVFGAVAPFAMRGVVADALPVEIRMSVHPWGLALAAAYGLLIALAFSLWPIGKARMVSAGALFRDLVAPSGGFPPTDMMIAAGLALAALAVLVMLTAGQLVFSAGFAGGAVVTFALLGVAARGLAGLARRASRTGAVRSRPTLRLALANINRPGAATVSVLLSLGLGLTILVAIAQIESDFRAEVQRELPAQAPAFFFLDIQNADRDAFRDTLTAIKGSGRIEMASSLRGRIVGARGLPAEQAASDPKNSWILAGDRGLTYSAAMPDHQHLIAGSWWPVDYRGPPEVSVSREVAQALGLKIGDDLTVNVVGRDLSAKVASIRQVDWTGLGLNFTLIYAPGLLEAAPQTLIATAYATPDAEPLIQQAVNTRFPGVAMIRVKDTLETIDRLIGEIGLAVRLTAGIALAAGTLVLAGAIASGERRRIYDAVVLKVLGATRRKILGAFLVEHGLLGLMAAGVAAVLGSLAGWAVVVPVMDLHWHLDVWGVVGVAGIAAAITLAFGFVGTWRALGQKAAPLLRNE